MSYQLDTDICIDALRGRIPRVLARMQACDPSEIHLSAVTCAELQFGALRSDHPAESVAVLNEFVGTFAVVPFDQAAAKCSAEIRAHLEQRGTPIGPNDLLIAATALANDLTLVTRNHREFSRVVGLRIEDWST